jgi:hypothetical protein
MTMRRTAQQFYYDVIAPEEQGMSYAQVYYRKLEDSRVRDWVRPFLAPHQSDKDFDEIAEHARSFVPTYSNDFLLDHIVGELIQHTEGEIQDYLKKLFVAKRHDPEENAGALPNSGDYDGDLILFHVGLSLACHEYANLFAKSVAYKFDDEVRRQSPEQRAAELIAEAEKLFAAQTKWHANGDQVKLELQTITSDHPMGAIIAHMTDRFILCHEVAHHLLGHTGRADIASHHFEKLPEKARHWSGKSNSHADEFQADALALILAAGHLSQRTPNAEDQMADIALGSLLTLTVLGQAAGFDGVTESHPPIRERLSQCASIIESLESNRIALTMAFNIIQFQNLLDHIKELR